MALPDFIRQMKQPKRGRNTIPLIGVDYGYRRPNPKAHSNPVDGASASSGRATADPFSYRAAQLDPFSIISSIDPGVIADHLKDMQMMMDQIHQNCINAMLYGDAKSYVPKPPSVPATVTTGEITAYRTWWVDHAGKLRSMTQIYTIWEPDQPMTGDVDEFICFVQRTGKNRFAGVYAYNSVDRAFAEFNTDMLEYGRYYLYKEVVGLALGEVKLWGQVVEHESGYRAQFAKLTKILKTHFFSQPGKDPQEVYFGSTD